jgi:ABC-2 type transport system ATP-binding protein
MITVSGLVKDFGAFRAVGGVSFEVPRGQILGFLGPNGAGKSTTMKMLTGFLAPTAGTATIGGKDIQKDSLAVRAQIGYLPESAPSYGEMTVVEFLRFIAEVRGKRGKDRDVAADAMRGTCALAEVWRQPIETLSKGYRQRVGFAQALIHDPPVLILDEPTDGLDPNQKHEVRQLIRGMGKDKTIVLSTHILEEVEAVCQRVVIIAGGLIVADATPADLLRRSKVHNAVTLRVAGGEVEKARTALAGLAAAAAIETLPGVPNALRVYPRGGESIALAVSELTRRAGLPVEQLQVEQGRLDEVFRQVTKGSASAPTSAPSTGGAP